MDNAIPIRLRDIREADLEAYRDCLHPDRAYHFLNGPYYPGPDTDIITTIIDRCRAKLTDGESPVLKNKLLIVNDAEELLGEVSWFWKSEETNWMEIGIVVFDEGNWGKGIGYAALTRWISLLFAEHPELVRIGLSTWSGNAGMIGLARKLGMVEEARYVNARIVNGEYFDSVSYGIQKADWVASGLAHHRGDDYTRLQ
ncbi:MAG: N-acetyltransferase [Spirochaetaceae bacterium]|nr:MAG: N-acetyltransferase [Spirochaetaceae bacterium]